MNAPEPPPSSPSQAQPPTFSKRQFLTGAIGGACALQCGQWIAQGASRDDKPEATFSQAGEDRIVWMLAEYLASPVRTYLDIGAADPVRINNTFLFYTAGARGVLVEPNPEMTARLRSKRPRDTVLPVGIGADARNEADFYRTTDPTWNTFDKETAESYETATLGRIKIVEVIKIPLVNINDVVAEHFAGTAPDFISLDVEGFEVPILKSLNFEKYRPRIFCIETLVAGTVEQKLEAVEFLVSKGYVARGASFVNTILVDQQFLARFKR
jgi:FkbM family methyltransferase